MRGFLQSFKYAVSFGLLISIYGKVSRKFVINVVETVVLSEKGQFVIPKRIRNKYGLAKGSKLVIFDDEGKLRIELADSVVDKLRSFEQHAVAMQGNANLSGDCASLPVLNSVAVKRDAREIT